MHAEGCLASEERTKADLRQGRERDLPLAQNRRAANNQRGMICQMLKRPKKWARVNGRANPHAFRHGLCKDCFMAGGTWQAWLG
jgi:integrase